MRLARRSFFLLCLAAVATVAAYGLIFPQVSWTEDVQLSNGTTIQVERKHRYSTTHPLGEARQYLMKSAILRVHGEAPRTWATANWSEPLKALLLDRDKRTGEFFIVAISPSCVIFHKLGSPNPRYLEYRYRDGEWQRVPLSTSSINRKANLLLTVSPRNEDGHVTLDDKRRRDLPVRTYNPYERIDLTSEDPCGPIIQLR